MTAADDDGHAERLRGVARGGALNLAGAIVAAVANVLLILIVTQKVSPERAGSLFAATSLFLIAATIARLGTTTGLVYWFARLRALDRSDQLGRCLRLALGPVVVVGVALALLMLAAAEPLGRLVGGDNPEAAIGYLRGLAAFLPLAALGDAVLAATRGLGNMRATVVVDKVSRPLVQVLLTVVVIAISAPDLLALAWAVPYVAAAVVAVLWLGHLWRRRGLGLDVATRSGDPDRPALTSSEFWRYTAPRSVSTLALLALQRMDIILVAALRGPADAAIYTAATRFLVVGQLGNQALAFAVQPRLAALMAVDDRAGAGRLYQVGTAWLILLTWPLYMLCLAFPSEVVGVFGDGYEQGASVVVVLALAMLVATACGMVDEMLNMAGKTVWSLANSVSALATMVVMDLLLIPPYGILGAAIGWAAAIIVKNIVPLVQLRAAFGLHPYGPETRRAMLLCAASLGVVPPLLAWLEVGLAWRVTAVLVCSAGLAAAVVRSRAVLALDSFAAALRRRPTVDVPGEPGMPALVRENRG